MHNMGKIKQIAVFISSYEYCGVAGVYVTVSKQSATNVGQSPAIKLKNVFLKNAHNTYYLN